MSETVLSEWYTNLYRRLSNFVGTGLTVPNSDSDTDALLRDLIDSGYRDFVNKHDWSFLRVITTLTTEASTGDYELPDDFSGNMESDLTWPENSAYPSIRLVSELDIRRYRQATDSTGRPYMAAIRPRTSVGITGQRYEIMFGPIPDGAYTLTYRYRANPQRLSTDVEYPLGGLAHSETILSAILSAGEAYMNDGSGIHTNRYMSALLPDSLRRDADTAPKTLGYNGNGCEPQWSMGTTSGTSVIDATVTVNGVQY